MNGPLRMKRLFVLDRIKKKIPHIVGGEISVMKWRVLGYHSPFPGPGGATPGYLLEAEGRRILIDCGSGVLSKLAQMCPPYRLDAVILSHLHHDHIADFFVLQYAVGTAMRRGWRREPLPVYAPTRPEKWGNLLSYGDAIRLHPIREGEKCILGGWEATFFRTDHAVPCFAVRLEGFGRTILYGADAGPKTDWTRMAREPDLFVCEGTFLERDLPEEPVGHLSVRQAAEAAELLRARGLLLTHLFPEYGRAEIEEEVKGSYSGRWWLAETGLVLPL